MPAARTHPALLIIAVIAVVFLLRAASQLLIPIVIAVLISYALEPVVAWAARRHVHRMISAGVLLALLLGIFGWGVYSLRDDLKKAVQSLPETARRARELIWSQDESSAGSQLRKAANELQGSGGSDRPQDERGAAGGTGAAEGSGNQDGQQPPLAGSTGDWVQRAVGSVLALAGHTTVIFFLVFFLLASGDHFRKRFVEIAGTRLERRRITATIIDDIDSQIQRFLLVRLLTAALVALATWGVLAWMGVQQAAVWGILAGVFNSIPYFGPIIVSGGLVLVGLVQAGDPVQALKMAGAALVITSLEGWLVTPALLGKAERMHVLVVFVGVLVWSWIWGAWGTILAVPMMVVLKAVADRVDSMKAISRLMAP